MFLVLSLIAIFCCYASEKEITNNVQIVAQTQTYYCNYQKVYYSDTKIHFYNPVHKIIESFKPNDYLENLFSTIPQQPLSHITAMPDVKDFFEKNKPFPTALKQLTELLTSINNIDCGNNNQIKREILYYLKLLFYNLQINENKELPNKIINYQNFLTLVETYIPATYNTEINTFKQSLYCINGSIFIAMFVAETVLSCITKLPEIILPVTLGPQAFIHCMFLSAYLKTCFSYKKYCKTIANITKEVAAHNPHDAYLDIDISE